MIGPSATKSPFSTPVGRLGVQVISRMGFLLVMDLPGQDNGPERIGMDLFPVAVFHAYFRPFFPRMDRVISAASSRERGDPETTSLSTSIQYSAQTEVMAARTVRPGYARRELDLMTLKWQSDPVDPKFSLFESHELREGLRRLPLFLILRITPPASDL